MTQYLLVENRTTILLGPMNSWKPRFIQAELDELEIDYKVSPAEPDGGYLQIPNSDLEIMTLVQLEYPPHDTIYQQHAGPFYTFNDDNTVTGTHEVVDIPHIEIIKPKLKGIVAAKRHELEISGTTTTIQDTVITLDTTRDGRNLYVQQYVTMKDGDTINWKFPEGWVALSYADLGTVIQTVTTYVQAQYSWENTTVNTIDAATTVEELKAISLAKGE